MSPAEVQVAPQQQFAARLWGIWSRNKWLAIFVIIPTLLAATYLYLVASNQYVSEAHFVVRSQSSSSAASSGSSALSGLLGGGGGGSSVSAIGDSLTVADYLQSHDAVEALQKRLDLVALFRRPEADVLSRLMIARPTPEYLYGYYQKQVQVEFDTDTGITTLTARAFRPGDAYAIASQLLQLGERRVNEMNVRSYGDAVSLTKRQLDETERSLRAIGGQVTNFRQTQRDVDPAGSASAQIGLVSQLQASLSAARSQLQTTSQLIGTSNPQGDALRKQIQSLEQQIASQNARLTGGSGAIATGLGTYEDLQTQRAFLQQRYASVSTSYEQARQSALKQQLYIVRVVNPNLPVKSIYPRRFMTTLTIMVILFIIYSIGWLVVAGVREHSN
jgi:capsular polysaccharide transport system permease protein